jgi:threonine/homoserine/homoserine lactone efflux protein
MSRLVILYAARTGITVLVWAVVMVFWLRAVALMIDAHEDLQFWLAIGLAALALVVTVGLAVWLVADNRRFRAVLKGSRR